MKTAIYVLYQQSELDKASYFLERISTELDKKTNLYLLINDVDCSRIRQLCTSLSDRIHVLCKNKNIGVASGRNLLIETAINDGAEFLISCDTDIIFERGYFNVIKQSYVELSRLDSKLGLVQPLLLNGPDLKSCFPELKKAKNWASLSKGTKRVSSFDEKIWEKTCGSLGVDKAISSIMHSGISNIWAAHFGAPIDNQIASPDAEDGFLNIFKTRFPTLRSEPAILAELIELGEPVRVSSTAGGISAFSQEFFKASGGYAEIFDPFAFEDSEFGFRTNLNGYNHYLLPKLLGIHDVFVSGQPRSLMNMARAGLFRGVETGSNTLSHDAYLFGIRQSLIYGLKSLVGSFTKEMKNGGSKAKMASELFGSAVSSYLFEFLRGLIYSASTERTERLSSLANLLRSGRSSLEKFEVEIDRNFFFCCRDIEIENKLSEDRLKKFSVHAFDCHFSEKNSDASLTTRFFDISLHVQDHGSASYSIQADLLSHDILHKVNAKVKYQPETAAKDGIIFLDSWDVESSQHNYGNFSLEDLFPDPTFWKSKSVLPALLDQISQLEKSDERLGLRNAVMAAKQYLQLGGTRPEVLRDRAHSKLTRKKQKKRILIFTDSRGQHKPRGCVHDVFAERMAKDPNLEVDAFLCPMKWTTTLDFLQAFDLEKLAKYDHVILYTGIVEWSPRKYSNALNDLYDSKNLANLGNLDENTRDYSQKVVNSKRSIFDETFGEDVMKSHFSMPFEVEYEGEKTINMYPLNEGVDILAKKLVSIPNLIFVTANQFVPGWRGDYSKERPANMSVVHEYSSRFAAKFPEGRLVDLMQWSVEDVKHYTCDNLHLSEAGSDWIYEQLMAKMGLEVREKAQAAKIDWPHIDFEPFKAIERLTESKISKLIKRTGTKQKTLGTLIIGLRLSENAPWRLENLKILLSWIDFHYQDAFDVLLVEQDESSKLNLSDISAKSYVRHEFIFNDKEYNRGWGYNVAVKHFCVDADVVALMDIDVLTGSGFISAILACHGTVKFCSPYLNVYYSDEVEKQIIRDRFDLLPLDDSSKIINPVTLGGGIAIFNKSAYLAVNGFEQYIDYSSEDRAMDVTVMNHFSASEILVMPETYVHLFHPKEKSTSRTNFEGVYAHLQTNYGCKYFQGIKPFEFIHKLCEHADIDETQALIEKRSASFGDIDLYSSGAELTINGQKDSVQTEEYEEEVELIFPSDFKGLSDYSERELYPNTPKPDSEKLAKFYNKYQGERCFIIGNGPSLNKHDLSLLEGEYSFGVNSFYYKTRETGFMPTFYVVEDSSVMKENIEEIEAFNAPYKFFPTIYHKLHPRNENTFFFEMNRGFYEKTSPNYVVPRFSTDASKVLYCGQSVTYINLQLAFFMGFTEVHLIGMDFDYVIPKSHKRTGDVLLSDTDDPNHFHKDYFGAGKTWKDPKLDRVKLNYKQAKLSFEAVGRRIYNTTIGGKLEVFDRVDFEDLLRDPKTNKKRVSRIAPSVVKCSEVPIRGAPIGIISANLKALQENAKILEKKSSLSVNEARSFLRRCSTILLLEKTDASQAVRANTLIMNGIAKSKSALSDEDTARSHFERVLRSRSA